VRLGTAAVVRLERTLAHWDSRDWCTDQAATPGLRTLKRRPVWPDLRTLRGLPPPVKPARQSLRARPVTVREGSWRRIRPRTSACNQSASSPRVTLAVYRTGTEPDP
jgi:hypothetical protein